MADNGAVLLDVREPHEWQAGHAPRARHIPLSQLTRRAGELPQGRAVVTVCRSGARSARAATLLARDGWEASNLTGGMRAWARAGLPVVAKGGGPGRIA
jgi:rhodanese-related sulfurtransferase